MLSRLFNNAVDKLHSLDNLHDELMLVESSPVFLRRIGKFENHRQSSSTGTAAFGSLRAVADGRESRFDRVGGSDVDPVLGGEVVEGEQHIFVIAQTGAGSWELWFVQLEEVITGFKSVILRLGHVHVVDHLLGLRLDPLGASC